MVKAEIIKGPVRDFGAGKTYPSACAVGEELQFPLAGSEHLLFVATGELLVLESNTNQKFTLSAGDTLRVSRLDTREYLNLRAKGQKPTTCSWTVIHQSR